MAPDREHRITNAVNSLISHMVPSDPDESEESAAEHHYHLYQLVQGILRDPGPPPLASDVNHASDLIKRKLIQADPSLALRFSNLYTRLLSLPVLGQKWAILYLLYRLSEGSDSDEPSGPRGGGSGRDRPKEDDRMFDEAFAPAGLKKIGPAPRLAKERDRQVEVEGWEEGMGGRGQRGERRGREMGRERDGRTDGDGDGDGGGGGDRDRDRDGEGNVDKDGDKGGVRGESPEEGPSRDHRGRSALLAEIKPAEMTLLRDLPFTLQGLSSATLPFPGPQTMIRLPATVPAPVVSILHALAEPSLLYRNLEAWTKSPARGLLGQSLRAAVEAELRSYLTLVATLEGEIRRAAVSGSGGSGGIVTLRRCVIWVREPTMGLRLMSVIAEESEARRGGQLISLIHGFSRSHGDPTVAAFAERLLAGFTRPFYNILRRWIYDGELSDPYLEFFVREKTPADDDAAAAAAAVAAATAADEAASAEDHHHHRRRKTPGGGGDGGGGGGTSVWEDKYRIDEAMIPSIITRDFAQKVFLIGKSLNFIRHSCGDSQWVEDYAKAASKELRYGDTATLEAWIDDAHKTTMRRLMDLMAGRFHLFEHLRALRRYVLLGQGDFIALLMESLAANLDRPAGAQYRHTLTAQLDHAIRGSNAQHDSAEVLRRLDARMLQLSHGDIGWDCFTLEYKIDAPVDVVVTDWGARQYLKVFNFLWRIKRVEFALASTWRRCMTGARGVLQTRDPAVASAWKATRAVLAEMVHFVGQLQYYILFEVIESSWNELQTRVRRDGCTLDDLIQAHAQYLNDITHKGLLGPRRARPSGGGGPSASDNSSGSSTAAAAAAAGHNGPPPPAGEDDRTSYLAQLGDILRVMLSYRDSVDGLYSWSVSDFTFRQGAGVRSSMREGAGETGGNDNGGDGGDGGGGTAATVSSEFPVLVERLRQLGTSFRNRLQILLGDLAYQPDVDMRFLGVAMNFNDVYQPARRKTRAVGNMSLGGR